MTKYQSQITDELEEGQCERINADKCEQRSSPCGDQVVQYQRSLEAITPQKSVTTVNSSSCKPATWYPNEGSTVTIT